jgi:hypothetical protein
VGNLNFIANPLDQELMQVRTYAIVGMNPTPSQDNTTIILNLGDEEHGSQSLAP